VHTLRATKVQVALAQATSASPFSVPGAAEHLEGREGRNGYFPGFHLEIQKFNLGDLLFFLVLPGGSPYIVLLIVILTTEAQGGLAGDKPI
jgi:hypothetical protein